MDEKNLRRRTYDALNVLAAIGVISKHKKDIQWVGWPTVSAGACLGVWGRGAWAACAARAPGAHAACGGVGG